MSKILRKSAGLVIVALLASAHQLSAAVIYNNSVNDLNLRFNPGTYQVGNEINFARFDAKLEQRLAELRVEIQTLKAELIKWMFLFWAGTALAGLLLR